LRFKRFNTLKFTSQDLSNTWNNSKSGNWNATQNSNNAQWNNTNTSSAHKKGGAQKGNNKNSGGKFQNQNNGKNGGKNSNNYTGFNTGFSATAGFSAPNLPPVMAASPVPKTPGPYNPNANLGNGKGQNMGGKGSKGMMNPSGKWGNNAGYNGMNNGMMNNGMMNNGMMNNGMMNNGMYKGANNVGMNNTYSAAPSPMMSTPYGGKGNYSNANNKGKGGNKGGNNHVKGGANMNQAQTSLTGTPLPAQTPLSGTTVSIAAALPPTVPKSGSKSVVPGLAAAVNADGVGAIMTAGGVIKPIITTAAAAASTNENSLIRTGSDQLNATNASNKSGGKSPVSGTGTASDAVNSTATDGAATATDEAAAETNGNATAASLSATVNVPITGTVGPTSATDGLSSTLGTAIVPAGSTIEILNTLSTGAKKFQSNNAQRKPVFLSSLKRKYENKTKYNGDKETEKWYSDEFECYEQVDFYCYR
jgi:hypothetical protein